MSKKFFAESLSDETLAQLTSEMLKEENMNKNITKPKFYSPLLKAISAAAAIVCVIGGINLISRVNLTGDGGGLPGDNGVTPGAPVIQLPAGMIEGELFLPDIIEKNFFEDRILAYITDRKAFDQMVVYYSVMTGGCGYMIDRNINEREKNMLLGYIRDYTDVTYDELIQMHIDYNIPLPGTPVDFAEKYAHVRFGETEDILLLEVEWHTPETFRQEYIEPLLYNREDFMQAYEYIEAPDEEKEERLAWFEQELQLYERSFERIENGTYYISRTINGKSDPSHRVSVWGDTAEETRDMLSEVLDENGYYIWHVYPYNPYPVWYVDENGDVHEKYFCRETGDAPSCCMYSKEEYARLFEEEIKPYADDLLERGLLTQQRYDSYVVPDPLEYYVNAWF